MVRVDVDPRTASHRLLDIVNGLLSPLLLVATLVGALFVGAKLQAGVGGAASKLSTRPETQFADAIGNDEAKAALNRVKAFMHAPNQTTFSIPIIACGDRVPMAPALR